MQKLIYYFTLLLTALDIIAIAMLAFFAYYAWQTGRLDDRTTPIFIVAGVIMLVLMPLIDKWRRAARVASKYDAFGRMKQSSAYERMSVKEQKALDKQRLLNEERILPMTLVKEMTHTGSKDPDADLAALTGLSSVKEKVEEMEARMEFEKKKKNVGEAQSKHMVFFGPPGTGKTTVARIMTAYLKKYGYIQENKLLLANGSFLSGADAADKTNALVRRAYGGVLFIDEAYSLLDGPDGDSAISTLIAQMEDNRDKFVLILAGYENEMKHLLKANPGFLSRIAEFFYFCDYTDAEMLEIFRNMAEKEGFHLSSAAEARFLDCVRLARTEASFGNARTCRTILDRSISRHSLNAKKGRAEHMVLGEEDIVYEKNPLAGR